MQKCVLIAQSCLILCDHMDCSPPGSSVHGILKVRILEGLAISFSRFICRGFPYMETLIPGWGTKILNAVQHGQKRKKKMPSRTCHRVSSPQIEGLFYLVSLSIQVFWIMWKIIEVSIHQPYCLWAFLSPTCWNIFLTLGRVLFSSLCILDIFLKRGSREVLND